MLKGGIVSSPLPAPSCYGPRVLFVYLGSRQDSNPGRFKCRFKPKHFRGLAGSYCKDQLVLSGISQVSYCGPAGSSLKDQLVLLLRTNQSFLQEPASSSLRDQLVLLSWTSGSFSQGPACSPYRDQVVFLSGASQSFFQGPAGPSLEDQPVFRELDSHTCVRVSKICGAIYT